jgi:monovalent cation/hydrogen antiporter
VRDETLGRVRGLYDYRRRRFEARTDGDERYEERTDAYRQLMSELFDAQREELVAMRNALDISDEVRRRIERELDLEESRIA